MIRPVFLLLPVCLICFTVISCASEQGSETESAGLVRTGEVVINNSIDQPESIVKGMYGSTADSLVFGMDLRRKLPYRLDLSNGEFTFLGASGRGPQELTLPSQIAVKSNDELFVYDTALDQISHFTGNHIAEKKPGYLEQGIWLRHTRGFYRDGMLITSAKEPEHLNALRFDRARPIAIMNLETGEAALVGEFSPTLDKLDSFLKYPYLALDDESRFLYYVFNTDHTVMRYNLESDQTDVVSDIRPSTFRTRTLPFDHNNSYHFSMQYSRKLNMDLTRVVEVGIVNNFLVVVWSHANEGILESAYFDSQNYDHFGIAYSLPDFDRAWQFSLPGPLLGFWNDHLLIEENDDVMEYTIGFYNIRFR